MCICSTRRIFDSALFLLLFSFSSFDAKTPFPVIFSADTSTSTRVLIENKNFTPEAEEVSNLNSREIGRIKEKKKYNFRLQESSRYAAILNF